jgi:hypothetical protein
LGFSENERLAKMRLLLVAWVRVVELSIVACAVGVGLVVGTIIMWQRDNGPLFIENPAPSASYIETPTVRAGGYIVTHRSLMRTDDCALRASAWIVDKRGNLLYPIQDYTAYADPRLEFVDSRLAFRVPPDFPVGKYFERTYATCNRNPVSEVSQKLRDLPFEVVK